MNDNSPAWGPDNVARCPVCESRDLRLVGVFAHDTTVQSAGADVACRHCHAVLQIVIADAGPDRHARSITSTIAVDTRVTEAGDPEADAQAHREREMRSAPGRMTPALSSEALERAVATLRAKGVDASDPETLARNRTAGDGPTPRQRATLMQASALHPGDLVRLGARLGRLAPECARLACDADPLDGLSKREAQALFDIAFALERARGRMRDD